MELTNIFHYFALIVYFSLLVLVFFYIKSILKKNGFNMLSLFLMTFTIFYLIIPFVHTFFESYRDNVAPYTQLLNLVSEEEILFNTLIAFLFMSVIIVSYKLSFKRRFSVKENINSNQKIELKNRLNYFGVLRLTDILLILGVGSIVLLIIEVGSLSTYLSLGALTRGLDKDPTQYIRSSYLQLVTLSLVILATPYLYLFLYREKRQKAVLIKFFIALLFSILFLFYNQGRAPLILFFLPFLFTFKSNGKKGVIGLSLVFFLSVYLLSYLDAIFNYISYGVYNVKESSHFITQFLREFSYPFTNFVLKEDLVEATGFRYFYDYVIWPFTMIPSSITNLFGIKKDEIVSVSLKNTSSYGEFLGVAPSGGIPVDFLTFNYYQYGYIALFVICIIVGRLLKGLDHIFYTFHDNLAVKVILYRICFSIINMMNNADISAIVRNRLDVVILIFVVIYLYIDKRKKGLRVINS
jgi:hypothetical protein